MHHLSIPFKNKSFFKINSNTTKISKNFLKYTNKDSSYTIKCFLDAIINSSTEDAKAYISKNYVDKIDLLKVKKVLFNKDKKTAPFIIKANFSNIPKNCKADTMYIFDKEEKIGRFLHILLLHEPDKFGTWKIYGIEEESI